MSRRPGRDEGWNSTGGEQLLQRLGKDTCLVDWRKWKKAGAGEKKGVSERQVGEVARGLQGRPRMFL